MVTAWKKEKGYYTCRGKRYNRKLPQESAEATASVEDLASGAMNAGNASLEPAIL
jgi:hypothetical protein